MTRDTVGYADPPDPPESDDRCANCDRRREPLSDWPFNDGHLCFDCAESAAWDWLQSGAVVAALTVLAALDIETIYRVNKLVGLTYTEDGDAAVGVAEALTAAVEAADDYSAYYAPKPKEEGL